MKKPKVSKEILEIIKKNQLGIKIDLGCGEWKHEGFVGIDILKTKNVDVVHDLEKYPWPLPNECAQFMMAAHLVEHISREHGGFLKFMNEAWRIMKYDGQFIIATPYGGSLGYYQDPTHVNFVIESSFCYFDPLFKKGDGSLANLYGIYQPAPWKIEKLTWDPLGNLEIALIKRRDDVSYHTDGKLRYA